MANTFHILLIQATLDIKLQNWDATCFYTTVKTKSHSDGYQVLQARLWHSHGQPDVLTAVGSNSANDIRRYTQQKWIAFKLLYALPLQILCKVLNDMLFTVSEKTKISRIPRMSKLPTKKGKTIHLFEKETWELNLVVREMKVNEQTPKSGLSHSMHKHSSEVQGNTSGDYEDHWANAIDCL